MKALIPFLVTLFCVLTLAEAQHIRTCTVMPVHHSSTATVSNLPPGTLGAVSYKPKYGYYWSPGSTIKVKLMGGSTYTRQRVMHHAKTWTKYANLNFKFVDYGSADIRVAFTQNGSSWSVVGKQALYMNNNEPTMNFGWLNDRTPDYEFQRTVLHEFGHALGLLHEHQNPTGGIPWDKEAVYDYYRRTQGWNRQTTYENVMQKAERSQSQYSKYDPESIMHYPIDGRLTGGQYEVGMNSTLSPIDVAYIAEMYPGRHFGEDDHAHTNTSGGNTSTSTTTSTSTSTSSSKRQQYSVKISNSLGDNQKAEAIHLYIGGKKYEMKLSRKGKTQASFNLKLPKGQHKYRLATASLYHGYTRQWDGRRYVRKYVEKTIQGSGSGILNVSHNEDLIIYGSYNKSTGKMKVYLGGRS